MGRKKIEIKHIQNQKMRRVTFRKRRNGLLKKAIELSLLTGAKVHLKIYHDRDSSLVEYCSDKDANLEHITKDNALVVKKYSRYTNDDLELIDQIDSRLEDN